VYCVQNCNHIIIIIYCRLIFFDLNKLSSFIKNILFDAAAIAVPAAACASLSRDFRDKDGGAALNVTLLLRCTSAAMSV
jgi:hypothetical protein